MQLILSKSDASDDAPGDAPGDVGPPKFIYGEFCGYNSGGLKFIFYSHEKGGMTYFVIKNKERITPLHRTFESKKYAITKPIRFDIKIDITARIKVNTTE